MALGAGASFVSVQLAHSFAGAGYRTLLIDGDVHRGTLHRELGVARRPGLTDYLLGHSTARRIVRETATPNLALIACGKRVANASALLGRPALVALLAELEEQFDVVLCDSAPFTARDGSIRTRRAYRSYARRVASGRAAARGGRGRACHARSRACGFAGRCGDALSPLGYDRGAPWPCTSDGLSHSKSGDIRHRATRPLRGTGCPWARRASTQDSAAP